MINSKPLYQVQSDIIMYMCFFSSLLSSLKKRARTRGLTSLAIYICEERTLLFLTQCALINLYILQRLVYSSSTHIHSHICYLSLFISFRTLHSMKFSSYNYFVTRTRTNLTVNSALLLERITYIYIRVNSRIWKMCVLYTYLNFLHFAISALSLTILQIQSAIDAS